MRVGFDKWWLLPLGILTTSALVALGVIVFGQALMDSPSTEEVAQRAPSEGNEAVEAPKDCSGSLANDYACYQERYQALVQGPGVDAAFAELKDEYDKDQFVKSQCHQLTHVIGRAAADIYGDIPSTYDQGDNFCWSGYYHGAMETVVANIGVDNIQEEADSICAELGDHQKYSFYHYNCVHGLGHGFMVIRQNELFDSLDTCDALTDEWERQSCYSGAFMENVIAKNNPDHPSKYLKADQPMYPCTDVETRYKTECYKMQSSHALETLNYNFAKVFDLCAAVEDDYRSTCYQSLGRDASGNSSSDVARTRATCMLGEDYEARSNCVVGAVKDFISYYHGDEQAKALCESFGSARLRDVCLQTGEEYYRVFQT